ncbi:bifunctional phosphopantothenoylcysteine decarboxylase/phosphopantothenate--cysteine ligase CoaBC [Ectothiorhodospiraceae bacterium 2226]|nr:bifunctional phosphopantothenoylcysteine decarboxylase/phosphopantothenate--cysteine ligase CoaBC [Ectothiorhodospiraceae bacterium 2226]
MYTDLTQRRVLLGVGGGIAAYKAPDLVRRLRERGADVRVVMTEAATAFITPLTLQAVSGRAVHQALLSAESEAAMGHIELARWAELVLIAPATADLMARLAHGHANDLLTTLCLASAAPLVLAPAMNRQMWAHPATQANAAALAARGVTLLGPAEGEQACGEVGAGRMLEPLALAEAIAARLAPAGPLGGRRVLITAGPTREPLDPVRYLTNRSSGRMGYAVARAAREAGAEVTLISGPVTLAAPAGVECLRVESAAEMAAAVRAQVAACDIFIGAAAVADYRAATPAEHKIKKQGETLTLELVRNPDILAEVAARDPRPFTVGFAAETDDLTGHAASKLRAKGLDMIAANRVGAGLGFDVAHNALLVLWPGGDRDLGEADKLTLARRLIELVGERYAAAVGAARP